jgi:hypothetical protein
MARKENRLTTAKEAAKYLRVSMFTLSKIEREGGLVPYRTPGRESVSSLGHTGRVNGWLGSVEGSKK